MFSLYTMSIRCNSEGIGSIIRRTDDQTLQSVLDDTFFYVTGYPPMVGRGGLEPPTSRLSGARSNHLSYRPILVEPRRIELLTS